MNKSALAVAAVFVLIFSEGALVAATPGAFWTGGRWLTLELVSGAPRSCEMSMAANIKTNTAATARALLFTATPRQASLGLRALTRALTSAA